MESLPAVYPDHWLVVHDATFFHMREGRFLFVDPAADSVTGQLRGMVSADFIAHYEQSPARGEHYVIETFFSPRRPRRRDRTDVVTVYDAASLEVAGEIVIPPRKVSSMPEIFGTALVADDRLLVVYNFAPGQSISVVDLEKREFVAEYPISGCALVIPTGKSGVTSLCSDGSLLTTVLTAGGEPAGSHRTEPIMDADDPMFEKAAIIDGIAYFPTFMGNVVPVDLNGEAAAPGGALVAGQRRGTGGRLAPRRLATGCLRPERPVLRADEPGREGRPPQGRGRRRLGLRCRAAEERVGRILLPNWGISIGVNSAEQPLLVVDQRRVRPGDLRRHLRRFHQDTGGGHADRLRDAGRSSVSDVLALASGWTLAGIFLLAAAHKVRNYLAFRGVLSQYRLLPESLVGIAAPAVVVAEIAAALALLTPASLVPGAPTASLAALLLCVYTGAIAVNLMRGRTAIGLRLRPASRRPSPGGCLPATACCSVLPSRPERAPRPIGRPACSCWPRRLPHSCGAPTPSATSCWQTATAPGRNCPAGRTGDQGGSMDSLLIASNVILWAAVLALALLVYALTRQVASLYERIAPAGALTVNESLQAGDPAPEVAVRDLHGKPLTPRRYTARGCGFEKHPDLLPVAGLPDQPHAAAGAALGSEIGELGRRRAGQRRGQGR